MNISVIIPVYKNKELFLKMLRHNLQFIHGCEIIVVNDDPSESLHDSLENFKDINLIENHVNLGFGVTVNKGVEKATKDYILLLNTDVKLLDDSFKRALQEMEKDSHIFGISFAQKEKDGNLIGKNRIYWSKGYFQHSKGKDLTTGINGWAEGGSCLIDKKKFTQLHGFDPLYSPFYWEDIDLSYQAWKAGYTILFDSTIKVEHHHESTIGKYFISDQVQTISYRNQFIFIWKNIDAFDLLFSHIFYTCINSIRYAILGKNTKFLAGLFDAFKHFPRLFQSRAKRKKYTKRNDKDILKLFYE